MPSAGSNSVHIRLDNKQNETIGKAARERGLSPSELCRRLILEGMDNLRPADTFRVTEPAPEPPAPPVYTLRNTNETEQS